MLKCPSKVIIHTGTNDAVIKNSYIISQELLQFKSHFSERCPECNIIISCPAHRIDNHAANTTLRNLRDKLKDLKIPVIYANNIDLDC